MRSDTQTITVERHPQEVFAFVAEPANLPVWAKGFARAIQRDGDAWRVTTPHGEEVAIRYVADPACGIVDFHISAAPGVEFVAASRVVPNGAGAEYIFTQFQPPAMPDAVFEGQVRTLAQEPVILKHTLELACPVTFAALQ